MRPRADRHHHGQTACTPSRAFAQPEARALKHGDWLALLLEREATRRTTEESRIAPSGLSAS
ncbi:MAG: IstB-like ATP-binding domain-containing protein [Rhodobacteraceae bacterium]|nr:IstB-like ATP-binding domain-containing protein [Paracoccaceae bacterium]